MASSKYPETRAEWEEHWVALRVEQALDAEDWRGLAGGKLPRRDAERFTWKAIRCGCSGGVAFVVLSVGILTLYAALFEHSEDDLVVLGISLVRVIAVVVALAFAVPGAWMLFGAARGGRRFVGDVRSGLVEVFEGRIEGRSCEEEAPDGAVVDQPYVHRLTIAGETFEMTGEGGDLVFVGARYRLYVAPQTRKCVAIEAILP